MSKRKTPLARYKVGDWVSFRWGGGNAVAQVIEQRGALGGPERRHIYRIRLEFEDKEMEPSMFELSEDRLEPDPPPA